jgi:Mn2+/Fe2+ NRAMP family transporter
VLGWKAGFSHGFHEARGFYAIIVTATVIGTAMSILEVDPIDALVWSAIINGVISVPIMVAMIWIGQSPHIVGRYTMTLRHRVFGWSAAAVMGIAVLFMCATAIFK